VPDKTLHRILGFNKVRERMQKEDGGNVTTSVVMFTLLQIMGLLSQG
jgi:hypothetical protein